jgi:hypothetical protein
MQLLSNNGLMLGTGAAARRIARQNNAYRLGGATNANRLRRAQQMGQRMNGGGNNQQRNNNNNNNVIGGVSRDSTHFLIFLNYSCPPLLIGKRSIFNFLVIGKLKVQVNPQTKLTGQQQQHQWGSESEQQQQSLGLGKQQPEIELVVSQQQ